MMPNHKIANTACWAAFSLALLAFAATACLPTSIQGSSTPVSPTLNPTTKSTPTQQLPTTTTRPVSIWLPAYLPEKMRSSMHIPEEWVILDEESQAGRKITTLPEVALSTWIYALAAPFPTITDEIKAEELKLFWTAGRLFTGGPQSLLVDKSTLGVLASIWGEPSSRVRVVPSKQLLDEAWQEKHDWAILPFEYLEPRWKCITLDGQNPLRKDFNPENYPLTINFGISGSEINGEEVSALLPETNRRADHLTTVILTGVTALVRGTAAYMENFGMDYPARDIGPWLREADILHISNEVAFAKNCPSPSNWDGLKFCSQARYIQLLESIGTDVVDLSGDHFADWGPEAMLFSLDLYRQRGWPVYGGGDNIEEAKKPALFKHNGNKIAFLGCNAKEIGYSTAGKNTPGAVHCDDDWLLPAIRSVKAQGYLPIVTFQHDEYYEFIARPQLSADFKAAAGAGAVIVSGSQAHQPHTFAFTNNGAFLHFGLGNLFFDQVFSMDATDQAFIDRHVFYEGKYIGTELLTIQFVNYALARPMSQSERERLLEVIYNTGGYSFSPVE